MPKLHINKSRPLFLFFIIGCCLMILSASHLLFPPFSKTNDLDVLILNKEATPTFHLTSQLSYTPELIDTWGRSFMEQTISTLDSSNTTNKAEPSLPDVSVTASTYANINLLIDLENTTLDIESLLKDLDILSKTSNKISLSILPASHMTDETYLNQCKLLYDALLTNELSSISLIIYPKDTHNLSLYNQDFITYIGTVLHENKDLDKLDTIYHYFLTKKTLFVRDDIKNFYSTDDAKAAKEINAIYHTLAIKYPGVDTIFSPYITPNIAYEDRYFLNHQDENYYLFYTIYNRLLEKNWITTTDEPVSSTSPYMALENYDSLDGQVEIVLAPEARILSSLEMANHAAASDYYVSFKWNTSLLSVTGYYPYIISLDTTNEPNGVSRLKAILQNSNNNIVEVYSIDLIVDNPVASLRSSRTSSTTSSSGTYTKDIKDYIPILMYHTVEDTVLPESQNSCVETQNFEIQMKALLDNGYTPINFYDLKAYLNGATTLPAHPIIITMDDGYLNNYTKAYPIFKKYNIQATLFVSPYYMTEANTERHFGWTAAKEMEESGLIDIQPHGYDHTPFPYLSLKDLRYHVSLATELIEQHLGPRDVSVVACPQFRNTRHTRKLLHSLGVDFQITSLAKSGTVLTPTSLKRINVPNTMTPDELIATLNTLTQ